MIAERQATEQMTIGTVETQWGTFGAVMTDIGLSRLTFPDEPFEHCRQWVRRWAPDTEHNLDPTALTDLEHELNGYLEGDLTAFHVPLDMRGTPFQLQVWRALLEIPYGETRSYAWVAERIGRPSAVRAVGLANGANPVPIVVPCHRVIGSNGTLTGYGGGLHLKGRLLELEGISIAPGQPPLW